MPFYRVRQGRRHLSGRAESGTIVEHTEAEYASFQDKLVPIGEPHQGALVFTPTNSYVYGQDSVPHMDEMEPETLVESMEPEATEAARELAAEFNIDLRGIQGSGASGRIVVKDVDAVIEQGAGEVLNDKELVASED